ncbi:MAG: hypothetical protein ACK4MF_06350, partial [Hyphomicrobiaceae bacterium]
VSHQQSQRHRFVRLRHEFCDLTVASPTPNRSTGVEPCFGPARGLSGRRPSAPGAGRKESP